MSHHSKAKQLLQQRDELDEKVKELLLVLETNNSTMDSPLVDAEGYPLNTIDVYAVRHARHDLICLRNDRAQWTEKIVEEMEQDEEKMGESAPIEEKPVHRTSNEPFVKVSSVVELSPADVGGFRKEDLIIQYGNLHHGNFKNMQQVAEITKEYENKTIRVTVIRDHRPVRLEISPKKWSGPGLLGCNIVPIAGANV
uniref:Nas2_N domain-containing protein n=1 Tax=Caenorhabditis tropicalis TaxID=1561998 RepID=A0A1I7TV71_9PELO